MARAWRGVVEEYRDHLPVNEKTPVVALQEGGTPLLPATRVSELTGCDVHLKVEGLNPTGSFKDRGMTMAISKAAQEGAQARSDAHTPELQSRRHLVCRLLLDAQKSVHP